MDNVPLTIGYTLDYALRLIGDKHNITINSTSTPYEYKKMERQGNTPIVVRQKTDNGIIILTTSYFK